MGVHTCKICKSPHRQQIEDWRIKDGKQYAEIIELAQSQFGLKLALGTLSAHFQYIGSEVAAIVEEQLRDYVKDKTSLAMKVPVSNIELATKIIANLVDDDGKLIPFAGDLLTDMMRERRQSAETLLKHAPGSPESKQAEAWADIARMAADRMRTTDDDEPAE